MVKTEGLATRSFRGSMSCRIRLVHWMYPIGSMYGILMVNVTIYGIHGSYGYWIPLSGLFWWMIRVSAPIWPRWPRILIAHHGEHRYEVHKGTMSKMWSAIEATAAKTEEEGGQRCWRNLEDLEGERSGMINPDDFNDSLILWSVLSFQHDFTLWTSLVWFSHYHSVNISQSAVQAAVQQ